MTEFDYACNCLLKWLKEEGEEEAVKVSCQMLEKDLTLIHQSEGITAIQAKGGEIEELRRQVATITEMVQCLKPSTEVVMGPRIL